jgi:hypothetical protein
MALKHLTLRERFEEYYKESSKDECWEWLSNLDKNGYGEIRVNNKTKKAHRISYELYKGEIPINMFICHKCDNPSCVNPNHLFLGTHQDNVNDKVNKKRQHSKLNENDIMSILNSNEKSIILSKIYDVSQKHINRIKRREQWKHIKEESINV